MKRCGYCGAMATKQVKQFGHVTYVCSNCYHNILGK